MVSASNAKRRNANLVGNILRGICLLKRVIEGKRSEGKNRKKMISYWIALRK
jgi:hypothetical protein